MGDTVTLGGEAQLDNFRDAELANGDPVVVVPIGDTTGMPPITLGTGFDGFGDLLRQLNHANRTGDPTRNITPENAISIEYATTDEFDICGIEGRADLDPDQDGD